MMNCLYYFFIVNIVIKLIVSYDPEDELKYVTNSLIKTKFDPSANSKIVEGDTQYVVLIASDDEGGLTFDSINYSTELYNVTTIANSQDLLIKLKGSLVTASKGEVNETNTYPANLDVIFYIYSSLKVI